MRVVRDGTYHLMGRRAMEVAVSWRVVRDEWKSKDWKEMMVLEG